MNITTTTERVFALRPNDTYWFHNNGFILTPRAGFEISERCPYNHKIYISNAIDQGWLTPVAYISEREKIFLGLSK